MEEISDRISSGDEIFTGQIKNHESAEVEVGNISELIGVKSRNSCGPLNPHVPVNFLLRARCSRNKAALFHFVLLEPI